MVSGTRVLDVGCGPGRHAVALAARGAEVVGVDLSGRFVGLAAAASSTFGRSARDGEEMLRTSAGSAGFVRADARRLPVAAASFDAAVCLCQGGFGLLGEDDHEVLHEMARVLVTGGRLALTAFSSYFLVRDLEERDSFDVEAGVNVERTTVRNEEGESREFELRTSCFTPRELRLLVAAAGLDVVALWSVAPGDYACRPPDLYHPEFLVVAERASSEKAWW